MGRRKLYDHVQEFDGSATGNKVQWWVVGIDTVTITIVRTDAAAASTAEIAVQVSANGTDWITAVYIDPSTGTDTDVASFQSVSNAAQMRFDVPVFSVRHIRVVVTTAQAGTRFTVSIYGEGEYEATGTDGRLGIGALTSPDPFTGRKA